MKNPFEKLFTKSNGNSKGEGRRRLVLESLENRILYSAAPVDSAPVDSAPDSEAPIEESYAVDVAYEENDQEGVTNDSPGDGASAANGSSGAQETQVINLGEGSAANSGVLDQSSLDAATTAAANLWKDQGLTAEQEAALDAINYQIGDLADGQLGMKDGNSVTLDRNAGGYGWFIDLTPTENEEFEINESGNLTGAFADSANGVDLLTAILHEQGHVLGLDHQPEGLMSDDLGIGSRLLPVAGQVDGAVPESGNEVSYLTFDAGTIIEPSDGAAVDLFGYSTAISGDLAVVGSRFDDDGGSNSGSAYIYQNISGTWTEVAKLTASDAAVADQFGFSVSIDGDQVVVGALFGDAGLNSTGAAYVFQRDAGGLDQWGEVAKLTASDAGPGDFFGFSVAINGNSVVVGAHQSDDAGSASGSAYVFDRNEGGSDNWGEVAKLVAADAAGGDNFGYTVAISEDSVIVGSRLDDDSGSASGSAYIFERNVGGLNNFGQQSKLVASDAFGGDNFGVSVAMSGNVAVVGARLDDDGGSATGSVYVFERMGGTWSEIAKLTAGDRAAFDQFGASVGLFEDKIVVGAVFDDDGGASSGSAYVFSRDEGGANNWGQVAKLVAPDAGGDDRFGQSVGIGSEGVVVGAFQNDNNGGNSGAAYIFTAVNNQTNVGLDGDNNLVIEGVADANNDITLVIEGTNVRVSDANATLVAGAGAVEDNGDLLISLASITGSAGILVNTGDGEDSLTVNFSGGDFSKAINYSGGNPTVGNGDQLTLTGGSFDSAIYTFENSSSGSIDLTGNETISYTGLEPITADIDVADATLNFEGGSETIFIRDAGADQTSVDSTAGESLVMSNPTNSLNINAGDGNDIIEVEGVGLGFVADLNIDGQLGNDQIDFQTSTINTGGGDISAIAEDIDVISAVNAAGGSITLNASGLAGPALTIFNDLLTAGSGSIQLTGSSADSRGVFATSLAANIVVENGSVEIFGQSDLREGMVIGASITATGSGQIFLEGDADGNSNNSRGVVLTSTANLQTGDGDIQIVAESAGTGVLVSAAQLTTIGLGDIHIQGESTGNFNGADGVQINSGNTRISTVDGNITIVGVSNAVTTNSNEGIQHSGGLIESTGTGNISLTGSGAGATGDGVLVIGTGVISANGGDISVTGDSTNDDGVSILNQVTNSGAGSIFIDGSGGPLTTDEGVVITGAGLVRVENGEVTITGDSAAGEGVVIFNTIVESTGGGDVTLTGVSSGNDIGVAVRGGTVRTVDGDIELNGDGGLQGVALVSGTAEVTGSGSIGISGTGGSSAGVVTSDPFAELTTNGGDIEIEGDNVILGGVINAGAGSVHVTMLDSIAITGDVEANGVTLIADSDNDSNGTGGGVTIESDATISVSFGGVNIISDEDIALTGITSSGTVTARSRSGAVIDGGDINSDVSGGRLVAEGVNGVGESSNALDTSLLNFEADGGTGGVFLENNVALTLGNISSMIGVRTDNAAIRISADGSLTVNEAVNAGGGNIDLTGGNSGTSGTGVNVRAGIATTGDGEVNITGTGGTGSFDRGVSVSGFSTQVTAEDGDIMITGVSANDDGVSVSSEISTSGTGSISIEGDGGTLPSEFGVIVSGSLAKVNSVDGDISIEGVSSGDEGVFIVGGANIISSGDGSITIEGSGDGGGPASSSGVFISSTGTTIETAIGDLSILGESERYFGTYITGEAVIRTNGAGTLEIEGISNGDEGVLIIGRAKVVASGEGSVDIRGSGSGTAAGTSHGVVIANVGTSVEAAGGTIVVEGNSAKDVGVLVTSGGEISNSGNGEIDVVGNGGTGSAADGVQIAGSTTNILTEDGAINITGSSIGDDGVQSSGRIVSQNGNIEIEGAGASAVGVGVAVFGAGAEVSSDNGSVQLTGTSELDDGVRIDNGASVNTTGTGSVSIEGTSMGGGVGDSGVVIFGGEVKTIAGDATISGLGAYTGLALANGGQVNVSGNGNLMLIGNGENGRGVHLLNGSSVSSSNGNLSIEGIASGLDGVDLAGSVITTTGIGGIDVEGSTLLMDEASSVESATDATFSLDGDVTLSTIVAVGEVTITSADGVIRDLSNATDVSAASATFSGVIAPGVTQGVLNVSGDFVLSEDSLFALDLDGLTAGEGTGNHDQANVAGGITISSGVGLVLKQTSTFTIGETITILNNDGTDPVNGNFSGLGEDDFISSVGDGATSQVFQISYVGGDGNDVQLTAIADADTSVSLDGETLVIRDELNNDTNDVYTISVVGNDLMITDPNQILGNQITGAEQSSLSVIWVPLHLFSRIRIESLGGDDTVNIEDLPGYVGGIDIDAGDGFDVINYNAQVTLSGGEDVEFRSETIVLEEDSEINATDEGGDSGNINLLAGRDISGEETKLSTQDGDIILEANLAGSESGDFSGISLEDCIVLESTGTGSISLSGVGGDGKKDNAGIKIDDDVLIRVVDGNIVILGIGGDGKKDNVGILIEDDSTLEATGAGSISLNGEGGASGDSNTGIEIDEDILIRVVDGNITLQGIGGEGKKDNVGISIEDDSILQATGAGSISLNGAGGATGDSNTGIEIDDDILIRVVDGNITLQGVGGGGKKDNVGILIEDDSTLESTGAGAISLEGRGGVEGKSNTGIEIDDDVLIRVVDGNLTLQGVGGDGTKDNHGISLKDDSVLKATGLGAIALEGTGGTDGQSNKGIEIDDDILISVNDGDLTLQGVGGDGKDHNTGISIEDDSKLRATGLGSISLSGTGGTGKNSNKGISISDGSEIETVNGTIDLLGVGGTGTGKFNIGIEISGSSIGSLFGDVNVVAFGGSGDKFNHGLVICGSDIYSDNGLVSLMGTAGNGDDSEDIIDD